MVKVWFVRQPHSSSAYPILPLIGENIISSAENKKLILINTQLILFYQNEEARSLVLLAIIIQVIK
jgi:hypothetical protein